jgi:hypothetical protein
MIKEEANIQIPDEVITSKIYFIRGKNVMLDQDLAELYNVETKRLNEQVKRNFNRFPDDFMFQLNNEEFNNLRSQFATANWEKRRTNPYAFTENGVLMLSSVLNSDRAINVNIRIIRIFSRMREILSALDILHSVNEMDSNSLFKAMGSTSLRVPAGSCFRPLLRFDPQAIPVCPTVNMS